MAREQLLAIACCDAGGGLQALSVPQFRTLLGSVPVSTCFQPVLLSVNVVTPARCDISGAVLSIFVALEECRTGS